MSVIIDLPATSVRIPIGGDIALHADVVVPSGAKGVVIVAHGSGSGRRSPRNRHVASELNTLQFATVVADLLTESEERIDDYTAGFRFDIPMLARRVVAIIDWAANHDALSTLPVGIFGASTGAAAALDAAAARPESVHAVVSRGGRPDLTAHLDLVRAATLLVVGGRDPLVLHMNEEALRSLRCTKKLAVVPNATHLFEEPGTLDAVANAAGVWFDMYLTPAFRFAVGRLTVNR